MLFCLNVKSSEYTNKMNSPKQPKKQRVSCAESAFGAQRDNTDAYRGFSYETVKTQHKLSVAPIETSKDKIEQPELAKDEKMFIPPLGSSVVICGKSGSGKSTLLANFMKDERFYGPSKLRPNGWFDKVFLFSPTANGDDVQRSLNIPKNHVFTDLDDAPQMLEAILNAQQQKLDKGRGADKVPQYCIIFDDVIGDRVFMNKKAFTRCFYQVRHVNCTTFICTQHFKRVPKVCRLQANFVFFFQGSASEVDMVVEDFAPPMYSKREFIEVVASATNEKYSFLTVNMKVGWDLRFRKNLDQFITLHRLQCVGSQEKDGKKEGKDGGQKEESDENENKEGEKCRDKKDEKDCDKEYKGAFDTTVKVLTKKYVANEQAGEYSSGRESPGFGGRAFGRYYADAW